MNIRLIKQVIPPLCLNDTGSEISENASDEEDPKNCCRALNVRIPIVGIEVVLL